jgi:hypothetical protein
LTPVPGTKLERRAARLAQELCALSGQTGPLGGRHRAIVARREQPASRRAVAAIRHASRPTPQRDRKASIGDTTRAS